MVDSRARLVRTVKVTRRGVATAGSSPGGGRRLARYLPWLDLLVLPPVVTWLLFGRDRLAALTRLFKNREGGLLNEAFALHRRLSKAYCLKEEIERLWRYTYEGAARRFFENWVRGLRWQRLAAFKKPAGTLTRHLDGILASCHHKVPLGVVEAINGNIRAMIRRGRGYRDHEYLILKVQKTAAQARLARAA